MAGRLTPARPSAHKEEQGCSGWQTLSHPAATLLDVTARANHAPWKKAEKRLRDLVDHLHDKDVVAVLLFGSMARGDQEQNSDLDVLVVVEDSKRREDVLSMFRAPAYEDSHTPLVLTVKSLRQEAVEHPSFVAHLLDEGTLLQRRPAWDHLRRSLASCAFDSAALAREVRNRARHLEPLLKSERFENSPVTALSHLYGIARSLVIARLLEQGIHEYSWQRAFDRYAELRPELRSTLDELKRLRPYYEYARARSQEGLPDARIGTSEIRDLASSVAHLAE